MYRIFYLPNQYPYYNSVHTCFNVRFVFLVKRILYYVIIILWVWAHHCTYFVTRWLLWYHKDLVYENSYIVSAQWPDFQYLNTHIGHIFYCNWHSGTKTFWFNQRNWQLNNILYIQSTVKCTLKIIPKCVHIQCR